MRLFTHLVFDQIVRGTETAFSPPEFNDSLGKAAKLVYEVEVEDSGGTSPTITVAHWHSNSGKGFVALTALVSAQSVADPTYRALVAQSGPLGCQGRVAVTLGGTSPFARVRIWATGWSE